MHYQKEKECIAVGCVPSAAVAVCWGGGGGGLLQGGGVCCRGVGVSAAGGVGGVRLFFPAGRRKRLSGASRCLLVRQPLNNMQIVVLLVCCGYRMNACGSSLMMIK